MRRGRSSESEACPVTRGSTSRSKGPVGGGLGVLDGVTVAAVCEVAPSVGLTPTPGRFTLERLLEADEVVVMSTVREVAPVAAVGGRAFDLGPAVPALSAAFRDLARSERTRR